MADKASKGSDKQDQRSSKKAQPASAHSAPEIATQTPDLAGIVQRMSLGRAAITPADVITLNRTVGMRRAMRLIDQSARPSQRSLARRGITIQPKLTVGAADDAYEQEADAMAARVMRMPAESVAPAIQHTSSKRPDDDAVRTSRDDMLDAFDPGTQFASQLANSNGGAPLPAHTRAFMEPRFGADFSKVRLHTGSHSASLNRAISAQAFTHGRDIYLGNGKNDLDTSAGKQLLAHELTHTIQQGAAPLQRQPLRRTFNHNTGAVIQRNDDEKVKIEDVEDEEEPRKWEPPKEIVQPSVPLMLTDAPWSEIEARQARERKERSQLDDPRYQNKLKEIGPKAPTVGKLSKETLGSSNQMLKENFQQRDPRYQSKLSEIGGTRSTGGAKLSKETLGSSNQMLKEQFQQRDPRYQKKLQEIAPKAPTGIGKVPEERKKGLESAFAQDKVNQSERALKKEEEARKLRELQAAKLEAARVSAAAKVKYNTLELEDKSEIDKDDDTTLLVKALKGETDGTMAFYKAKLAWAQHMLEWTTKRLSRRSLLKVLKAEITSTQVVGRFKTAFTSQATAQYNKIAVEMLTADRSRVTVLMSGYRNALKALAAEHKKVDTFDKTAGAKFGKRDIRDLLALVDSVIVKPDFDADTDKGDLDEKIKAVTDAIGLLGSNEKGRIQSAQKSENKLAAHSTEGQDPRGKLEEDAALKKINELFTKVKSDISLRDTGVTTGEADDLRIGTDILSSFSDRTKEKKAHDLKTKYEAAPFYLDTVTSKIVHADRHMIKGMSGFKSATQLEQDYKDEVDKQYKASKGLWCKYLGYTNGTGNARVTNTSGGHGGVVGHHSVFLGNYAAIVNAKDKNASADDAVDKTADELLDILYPNSGVTGAHYTLEFTDPKPHAYRGGPTLPGAAYQADRIAGNETWTNAEAYMEAQQQAEEFRVRNKIAAAIVDHMKALHRTDPDRRKPT